MLLLAGVPPFSLLVDTRIRIYHRIDDLKREDILTVRAAREVRNEEFSQMREEWRGYLSRPNLAGTRTLEAVRPHLDSWLDKKHGNLTYRMTQLLTGHRCFSTFLYRIKKSPSVVCFHCSNQIDSAEHMLAECEAWRAERADLQEAIGRDITLSNTVGAISVSREAWRAFQTFAEGVMMVKEEAERQHQIESAGMNLRGIDPERMGDESDPGE